LAPDAESQVSWLVTVQPCSSPHRRTATVTVKGGFNESPSFFWAQGKVHIHCEAGGDRPFD